MASGVTLYREEYCGMKGKKSGGGGGGGKGGGNEGLMPCSKSYEEQPVGGRCAVKAREAVEKELMELSGADPATANVTLTGEDGMPVDTNQTVYEYHYTRAVQPQTEGGSTGKQQTMDGTQATMPPRFQAYEGGDPCNPEIFNVYRTAVQNFNDYRARQACIQQHSLQ